MSAPTYTVTITDLVSVVGNGVNDQNTPIGGGPVQFASSPGIRGLQQILGAGDTTITPPQSPLPTAKAVKILASDGTVLKWKGAGGDTGYQLGFVAGMAITIPVGTLAGPGGGIGSFILNAAGQTVVTIWWL